LGVASGYFSEELQQAQQRGQLLGAAGGVQNYEAVIELTYRFDFRESALFIQPDFQYIVHPGGTTHLNNAPVFGLQLGINF
jgi:porin